MNPRRSKVKAAAEVPLKRDETWWLHPAYRGEQALPLTSDAGEMPHRWVRSDAPPTRVEAVVEDDSHFADLAKVLYRLNGARPGPVRGFYVIVAVASGRYAVGQLCADPAAPVQLFEDLVFASEAKARAKATELRAAAQLSCR
ncbi:MAG: hypothetical protein EXR86_02555 [Gammaproteobacteria bacterium]|nr:hypothetical protein [Gammaproteobacteria bacterium]